MSSGSDFFLKKALGEDFFQSLEKFELWKPGTKTVVDHEEIKTALKIVPRTLMSFLIGHLTEMKIGETKEISIPLIRSQPKMEVTKHENDVYTGHIVDHTDKGYKKVAEFKNRSIPGVGLIVMSTFELYEVEDLTKEPAQALSQQMIDRVQSMIDERLALNDLIGRVVDKKIAERDAVQALVLAKLSETIQTPKESIKARVVEAALMVTPKSDHEVEKTEEIKKSKGSPLQGFLEGRKQKLKKNEFAVQLVKGETVNCPDCGNALISEEIFSGCICLGADMDKKLYFAKSEDGYKVRFGRGWDPENIEMLLEVLRRRRG